MGITDNGGLLVIAVSERPMSPPARCGACGATGGMRKAARLAARPGATRVVPVAVRRAKLDTTRMSKTMEVSPICRRLLRIFLLPPNPTRRHKINKGAAARMPKPNADEQAAQPVRP